ncbi:MAG: phosphoribosylaminoimidazolesuccinocarboxamide synthase [Acidimicrobiia bacterium]
MSYELIYRGKVRDVYAAGAQRLLIVASDRVSAFDVVMAEPVPGKGRVLTAMSAFWFERLAATGPSHLITTEPDGIPDEWVGRTMLTRKADMLPIECIVRGYLSGSAWKEYREKATVHGAAMPAGLEESSRLPEPIFTPSTKAADGDHDINIGFDDAVAIVGRDLAERARAFSLALYAEGSAHAAARGIIVADTKFEMGLVDGELVVADEVLTPDSSRFWPSDAWQPGTTPPAYDKQPLRDYLESTGWDKRPPAPPLPPATIDAMRARYIEGYERISSRSFAAWPGSDTPHVGA